LSAVPKRPFFHFSLFRRIKIKLFTLRARRSPTSSLAAERDHASVLARAARAARETAQMRRAFAGDSSAQRACSIAALDVTRANGRSAVTRCYAEYPVKYLTPKRGIDGDCDCAWAYAVNMGGGLVSGDASGTTIRVDDGCALALATQGTQKVYKHNKRRWNDDAKAGEGDGRSNVGETTSALYASVGDGGLLALLPDPTQIFADAVFRQTQTIDMHEHGSCVCVDWITAGRVGYGNERWAFKRADVRTRVTSNGEPVVVEATRLEASSRDSLNAEISLAMRMGAVNVVASLIIVGPRVRELAKSCGDWARDSATRSMAHGGASWVRASPGSVTQTDPQSKFFVSASDLPLPHSGIVLRFFAADSESVQDVLRSLLAPLASQLGAPPYDERGGS
jgi:urease accessory protein